MLQQIYIYQIYAVLLNFLLINESFKKNHSFYKTIKQHNYLQ